MISWIAAWIALFAAGMLVAVLADRARRRENLPVAGLMLTVFAIAGYIVVYR